MNVDVYWPGRSPLHDAVVAGNARMARLLLKNGADVNCRNKREPLLYEAIKHGRIAIAKQLLEYDVLVNGRNDQERTPLHQAARSGNEAALRLLLKHGAKVDSRDMYEKTPLYLAVQGHGAAAKLLLQHGADKTRLSNKMLDLASKIKQEQLAEHGPQSARIKRGSASQISAHIDG